MEGFEDPLELGAAGLLDGVAPPLLPETGVLGRGLGTGASAGSDVARGGAVIACVEAGAGGSGVGIAGAPLEPPAWPTASAAMNRITTRATRSPTRTGGRRVNDMIVSAFVNRARCSG